MEIIPGKLAVGTMHLAKGLELRAAPVMARDDEVLPLQKRIEAVGLESSARLALFSTWYRIRKQRQT